MEKSKESPYEWLNKTLKSVAMALELDMHLASNDTDEALPDRVVLRYEGVAATEENLSPEMARSAYDIIRQATAEESNLELSDMSFDKKPMNKFAMTLQFVGKSG